MSTYKVIQDIEAEDKLVGPLTLRQFVYAGIAALSGYLGFLTATKGAAFMLVVFAPITGVCGFFAFPWGQDQPTEVWALAKIRFYMKPRKRRWDQTGAKELVTVTAPKVIEVQRTNGLRQDEVQSRLSALANTLDSRGWAVKNVNVNAMTANTVSPMNAPSDRLVQASSLPQEVVPIEVTASDDILDENANPVAHHFETMITEGEAAHRQQLIAQLQSPDPMPMPQPLTQAPLPQAMQPPIAAPMAPPMPSSTAGVPGDYWFMQGPAPTVNQPGQAVFTADPVVTPGIPAMPAGAAQAAEPTPDEQALIDKLKAENDAASMPAAYGHLKTLKTPEQLEAEAQARAAVEAAMIKPPAKPTVTPSKQAAIINLANNDDWDVATLARQAKAQVSHDDDEVVISLH